MPKAIPLTQGKFAIVDEEDYTRLMQHRWCAMNINGWWYAGRRHKVEGKPLTVYMHRAILNPLPAFITDHINGNGLDNRRCNLRVCTDKGNSNNRKDQRARGLGLRGDVLGAEETASLIAEAKRVGGVPTKRSRTRAKVIEKEG